MVAPGKRRCLSRAFGHSSESLLQVPFPMLPCPPAYFTRSGRKLRLPPMPLCTPLSVLHPRTWCQAPPYVLSTLEAAAARVRVKGSRLTYFSKGGPLRQIFVTARVSLPLPSVPSLKFCQWLRRLAFADRNLFSLSTPSLKRAPPNS